MLRPRFKLPSKISAIWWPRYVDGLRESGIWDAIVDRIVENGFAQAAHECGALFDKMRRLEQIEVADAIGGEGYQTLWPAGRR